MALSLRTPRLCRPLLSVSLLAVLFAGNAHADPDDFVFEPYAEPGTVVVQYAGGLERGRDGSNEGAHSLAIAWGVSDRWFTAFYAGWYKEAGHSTGFDATSWVNHVALTPPGGAIDLGAYLEIERPKDRSEGYSVTWGPTLQFDGPLATQVNVNLWLQRTLRGDDPAPTLLIYQWQIKRLWRPQLEWGAQGFGEGGNGNPQAHSLGPAIFARWSLGQGQVLRADAAALVGVGSNSPRATLRLRTQLQF